MYEVTRDINLNEEGSTILQPLFNLSVTSTSMDGYEENGTGGNAGLRVDEQELTTGTAALGARVLSLFGQNVFGRDVLGELRVNVAQDFGDNQSEAGVGFVGVPGFQRTVRGAESGETAIQVGAGLVTDTTSDETISSTEDQKKATPSGDGVVKRFKT